MDSGTDEWRVGILLEHQRQQARELADQHRRHSEELLGLLSGRGRAELDIKIAREQAEVATVLETLTGNVKAKIQDKQGPAFVQQDGVARFCLYEEDGSDGIGAGSQVDELEALVAAVIEPTTARGAGTGGGGVPGEPATGNGAGKTSVDGGSARASEDGGLHRAQPAAGSGAGIFDGGGVPGVPATGVGAGKTSVADEDCARASEDDGHHRAAPAAGCGAGIADGGGGVPGEPAIEVGAGKTSEDGVDLVQASEDDGHRADGDEQPATDSCAGSGSGGQGAAVGPATFVGAGKRCVDGGASATATCASTTTQGSGSHREINRIAWADLRDDEVDAEQGSARPAARRRRSDADQGDVFDTGSQAESETSEHSECDSAATAWAAQTVESGSETVEVLGKGASGSTADTPLQSERGLKRGPPSSSPPTPPHEHAEPRRGWLRVLYDLESAVEEGPDEAMLFASQVLQVAVESDAASFNGEKDCWEAPIRVRSRDGVVLLRGMGRHRGSSERARLGAHAMALHDLSCKIGGKVLQEAAERTDEEHQQATMQMLRDFVDMRLDAISRTEALSGLSARRRARGHSCSQWLSLHYG